MLKEYIYKISKKWWSACSVFFKIMIPVSIIIKILQETHLLSFIGKVLEPLMLPLGLPGEMSLVWVTAMFSNIYGGLLALSSIYHNNPLTIAQITILATLILFAHTFLIEIPIYKKAGAKILPIFLSRCIGGYIFAIILNMIYSITNSHQTIVDFPLLSQPNQTIYQWVLSELVKYITIAGVVMTLIITLDLLEKIKFIELINKLLYPVIKLLGISEKVMPLTIIGMTMGLAYGGGLIIAESKEKDISKKDIFLSLALLSLFHSLIEDSLLMISIGANWVGIFIIRFIYSIIIMILIKKLTSIIPLKYFVSK